MRRIASTFPAFLTVYVLLYAAFGVQSPFLPALLRERGLHAEEIGIVLAASTAIRVLAGPAVGHAADRLRVHMVMLCVCALAAAIAGLGYVAGSADCWSWDWPTQLCWHPSCPFPTRLPPVLHGRARWVRTAGSSMGGCERLDRPPSSPAPS
jgi:MFS family permease